MKRLLFVGICLLLAACEQGGPAGTCGLQLVL
jgi:hypothetical protein